METKTKSDPLLLEAPDPDTRPLLLARNASKRGSAQSTPIPERKKIFLRKIEKSLRCRKEKKMTCQKGAIRSIQSASSAKRDLKCLENNGDSICILNNGKNQTHFSSLIRKGRRTLRIFRRFIRGIDRRLRDIKENPGGFLERRNRFPEKISNDQGRE